MLSRAGLKASLMGTGCYLFLRRLQQLSRHNAWKARGQHLITLLEDLLQFSKFHTQKMFYENLITLYVHAKLYVFSKKDFDIESVRKHFAPLTWEEFKLKTKLKNNVFKKHFIKMSSSAMVSLSLSLRAPQGQSSLLKRQCAVQAVNVIRKYLPNLYKTMFHLTPEPALRKLELNKDTQEMFRTQKYPEYKTLLNCVREGNTEAAMLQAIRELTNIKSKKVSEEIITVDGVTHRVKTSYTTLKEIPITKLMRRPPVETIIQKRPCIPDYYVTVTINGKDIQTEPKKLVEMKIGSKKSRYAMATEDDEENIEVLEALVKELKGYLEKLASKIKYMKLVEQTINPKQSSINREKPIELQHRLKTPHDKGNLTYTEEPGCSHAVSGTIRKSPANVQSQTSALDMKPASEASKENAEKNEVNVCKSTSDGIRKNSNENETNTDLRRKADKQGTIPEAIKAVLAEHQTNADLRKQNREEIQTQTSSEESETSIEVSKTTTEESDKNSEVNQTSTEESKTSNEVSKTSSEESKTSLEEINTSNEMNKTSAEESETNTKKSKIDTGKTSIGKGKRNANENKRDNKKYKGDTEESRENTEKSKETSEGNKENLDEIKTNVSDKTSPEIINVSSSTSQGSTSGTSESSPKMLQGTIEINSSKSSENSEALFSKSIESSESFSSRVVEIIEGLSSKSTDSFETNGNRLECDVSKVIGNETNPMSKLVDCSKTPLDSTEVNTSDTSVESTQVNTSKISYGDSEVDLFDTSNEKSISDSPKASHKRTGADTSNSPDESMEETFLTSVTGSNQRQPVALAARSREENIKGKAASTIPKSNDTANTPSSRKRDKPERPAKCNTCSSHCNCLEALDSSTIKEADPDKTVLVNSTLKGIVAQTMNISSSPDEIGPSDEESSPSFSIFNKYPFRRLNKRNKNDETSDDATYFTAGEEPGVSRKTNKGKSTNEDNSENKTDDEESSEDMASRIKTKSRRSQTEKKLLYVDKIESLCRKKRNSGSDVERSPRKGGLQYSPRKESSKRKLDIINEQDDSTEEEEVFVTPESSPGPSTKKRKVAEREAGTGHGNNAHDKETAVVQENKHEQNMKKCSVILKSTKVKIKTKIYKLFS